MPLAPYGPVPISRLKAESGDMYDALERGRKVLISNHGRVVATIDPSRAGYEAEVQAYSLPGTPPLPVLRVSEFSNGRPSDYISRAAKGEPSYVTKGEKVYGILREPDEEPADRALTTDEARRRQEIVADFLAANSDADAEALIEATDRATATVLREAAVEFTEIDAAALRDDLHVISDSLTKIIDSTGLSKVDVHGMVALKAVDAIEDVVAGLAAVPQAVTARG